MNTGTILTESGHLWVEMIHALVARGKNIRNAAGADGKIVLLSAVTSNIYITSQVMLRQDLPPYATPECTKESVTHHLP